MDSPGRLWCHSSPPKAGYKKASHSTRLSLQLFKGMLVRGMKAQTDKERYGQAFIRIGDHEVRGSRAVLLLKDMTACHQTHAHDMPFCDILSRSSLASILVQRIRGGLGIENRLVGYVFLIDGKGRIRWR
jgi:hypothetical protein